MHDSGSAERRSSQGANIEIVENFDALAILIQDSIDRLAISDSAGVRERLERAKAAAERGASLARKLPNQ